MDSNYTSKSLKAVATLIALALVGTVSFVRAETTAADIAKQELELKEKQIELEKAKLGLEKSAELQTKIAELELEVKKLELEKARRELNVKESSEKLSMLVQGNVLFDTADSNIKKTAEGTLDQVALILSQFPKGEVIVTGYADSRGDAEYNLNLSRERARAVKDYLVDRVGVESTQVVARGMGEKDPVAPNDEAEGRKLNRRVEIDVIKQENS